MKKCPYCAEEIQDEAIVCRYCNRDLVVKPQENKPSEKPSKSAIGIILLILGFLIVGINIFFAIVNYADGGTRMLNAYFRDGSTILGYLIGGVLLLLGFVL